MGTRAVIWIAFIILSGCAAKKPVPPAPGAETVRVGTSHPGASFSEVGSVSGVDGEGCGKSGSLGSREGAVASLMKNAFALGGTHVQVFAVFEPRQMGDCFVNIYRISGTAYREARAASLPLRAAPQPPGGDVVQALRDLQKLRDEGAITQPEFEKLKARIIGAL